MLAGTVMVLAPVSAKRCSVSFSSCCRYFGGQGPVYAAVGIGVLDLEIGDLPAFRLAEDRDVHVVQRQVVRSLGCQVGQDDGEVQ